MRNRPKLPSNSTQAPTLCREIRPNEKAGGPAKNPRARDNSRGNRAVVRQSVYTLVDHNPALLRGMGAVRIGAESGRIGDAGGSAGSVGIAC